MEAGLAGFASAIKGAELGAKVAIIEHGTIGGTCLNRGCIPTKNLLRASEIFSYRKHNPFKGFTLQARDFDFSQVISQKDELVLELRKSKYLDVLEVNDRMTLFQKQARFISPKEVQIGEELFRAEKYIIATGASPTVIKLEGLEKVQYLTSTEALELRYLPASMLIIGGGVVAVELAQMFSRFGTEVTILEALPKIVAGEEEEISHMLQKYLEEEGISVHTATKVLSVQSEGKIKLVYAQVGGEIKEYKCEELLLATGRRANTSELSLNKAGVELDPKGTVKVDANMRTSAPNIWAAGDAAGEPMLVTVAAHEGAVAAENALSGAGKEVDYSAIAHAIFTAPQVGSVGIKEEEAKKQGIKVQVRNLDMKLVPKAAAIRDTRGFIKMIIEEDTRRVLGVHVLSFDGAEIINEAAVVVKNRLTIDQLVDTIHVYPTMAEAVKLVAQSFVKDIAKLSCCAE